MPPSPAFTGVYPILATPFDDDEALDTQAFGRIVDFMARLGLDGVTILGVLGEANRLTDDERHRLVDTAVEAAAGRLPVIVGASHAGTRAACQLARMAAEAGASGLMLTPSREPTPNAARIYEYFARVCQATELPVVLQDHPASTQVHMSLDLVLKLVHELPQIACIKQEAPPSPARISGLVAGMKNRRVPILTGLGALYGLFELERGADGFMTGFAFPEVLQALVSAARAKDEASLQKLYTRFLPLIVFEQQPGVAIRKEIYRRRGLMRSARVRHPGASIDAATAAQLESLLEQILPGVDVAAPLSL